MNSSSLSVTAKYIDDLVSYHFLNSLTSRLQVLARIKVIRMLSKVLADCSGHSQTDIRVDVDLANGKLSSLSQLILRNTYCIRHISAVDVYKRQVQKKREEDSLLYEQIERIAPMLIAKQRKMYKGVSPNVDFYSGFVYDMLGICLLYTSRCV